MAYRISAISSFVRAVLVTSVMGYSILPRGSILTVITLQLLPFIPSSSLVRCKPVQVYHHHP
jgi:hypothetical protein